MSAARQWNEIYRLMCIVLGVTTAPVEVRCPTPQGNGNTCGRWLMTTRGQTLEVYCPKRKTVHTFVLVVSGGQVVVKQAAANRAS